MQWNCHTAGCLRASVLFMWLVFAPQVYAHDNQSELVVWGESRPVENTLYNPVSVLTVEDMVSINAATTEDLLKYEPSLIIRRRFIGDANGTLGMRGSNMFQTSRSMVFADGVPLHYLLETRWAGSPRWSLVSADEIAEVQVVYGPYSAEYSGNAMGGVINIETAIPTARRFHLEGSLFSQQFQDAGIDDQFSGDKLFFSYGDRFDNLSLYLSYNSLGNESQPMNFRLSAAGSGNNVQSVSGAVRGTNVYGVPVMYFGDDGATEATTDHYKVKIGYQTQRWALLFNVAYEDRNLLADSPHNYLRASDGSTVWDGNVEQDGFVFNVRHSHFAVSEQDRQSLLLGARLQGELSADWWMEANISRFEIVKDETRASFANPADPVYTPAGNVTHYDDTGWQTAEVKLQNDRFAGNENLSLVSGLRYEDYSLRISNYASDDYASGIKTLLNNASGGKSAIQAAFAQLSWQVSQRWDLALGGRYEDWQSMDGFYDNRTNADDNAQHPDRAESRFSPKFSVGYVLNADWLLRYSLAKAYRFPIVEELFRNVSTTQSQSIANAALEPETGLHQNLMFERALDSGYTRFNIFKERIEDVIFAQSGVINNIAVNTFIPIDQVDTQGIEWIYNQPGVIDGKLDVRLNVSYTDAEIVKNIANPVYEGKAFPRVPDWRASVLMTWHLNEQWDIGGGVLYADHSFNDLDNGDSGHHVFGAMDAYRFINLKTTCRFTESLKLSAGVDNVTDEIAYVYHPWPGRTVYLEGALDF